MPYTQLEKDLYEYEKSVTKFCTKEIINHSYAFLENMYMFVKNLDLKITARASEIPDTSYDIIFDWFGKWDSSTRSFSKFKPYEGQVHQRVIQAALQTEINNKFPDISCKIMVIIPIEKIEKLPAPTIVRWM